MHIHTCTFPSTNPHIATYIDICTYKNTQTDSDTHTHTYYGWAMV